jgi:hypothetical protein
MAASQIVGRLSTADHCQSTIISGHVTTKCSLISEEFVELRGSLKSCCCFIRLQ